MVKVEVAIRGDGVKSFREQEVEVVIVRLQRGEAVGIPADVECGTQWIIILRNFAELRDFVLSAGANRLGLQSATNRMESAVGIGTKNIGQIGIANQIDDENDENDGEKRARKLENAASAAPATALFVVENGLAFRHSGNPS